MRLSISRTGSAGVDLEPPTARRSAQLVFEDQLDTGLPDLVVELVGLGAFSGLAGERDVSVLPLTIDLLVRPFPLSSRNRADIAEQVRGETPVWVAPHGPFKYLDAGELVGSLGQENEQFGVDVDRHRDALEWPVGRVLVLGPDVLDLGEATRAADRNGGRRRGRRARQR